MTAFEEIRQDLSAYPPDLVNWEAACLKDMASLLDSLEHARTEWQSLSRKLEESQARLETGQRDRERLARTEQELAEARRELDAAEAGRERAGREAARVTEELAAAREELEQTGRTLERVRRERDLLAENEQGLEGLRAEVASLRRRLKEAERAASDLEAERARAASMQRELERVHGELANARREQTQREDASQGELAVAQRRVAEIERECERLGAEVDEKIVLVCDLRVRENRLEHQRDEAVSHSASKVRKILDRVHEALDRAGAPRDAEASYGERIRWLAARVEELEGRSR